MTEHVQVDAGLPTCLAVHYMTSLEGARAHFHSIGFRGISDLAFLDTRLNCNDARSRALDAARRGEGKCFWQGAWDYSAMPCNIYKFDFTSYNGPRFKSPKNGWAEYHADWEPS